MSEPEDGAESDSNPVDEFDWIDRLLRPLAWNAPEALDLRDDAAAIPSRPGFDLVLSKDAMVEGVHFLPDDPLETVAGKLLRVNLSDLAAKGAEPYGYFLATAWPAGSDWTARRAFASGLRADQSRFGLKLLGGDTVATPGPAMFSLTILGWVPAGAMVRRAGATPGDRLLVTGTIGDGGLGLDAARGGLAGSLPHDLAWLKTRYQTPQPRLGMGEALRAYAHAAADVSDGLLADAGHLAETGGVRLELDLDRIPLSPAAKAWLTGQDDAARGRLQLAAGGDDYEIVCAAPADAVVPLTAAARAAGFDLTDVGVVTSGQGVAIHASGRVVRAERLGWRHGG